MKAVIKGLLSTVGLAPASHVQAASDRGRKAAEKAVRLEERLTKLQSDAETWKRRQQDATDTAAEWKNAASSAAADAEQAARNLEKATAHAEEWKQRADALAGQVRELRERLDESRRVATRAREHLMATEVKLDLIEAAIQVLDVRTRP